MPPNLARRTPQEIIQVVNQVSSRKNAIAARTLPSSDILVTFKDEAAKAWHAKNKDWILQAFGPQAKEAQRTVAVLIKGLRKADLQEVTEGDFADELGFKTVDKVKFRIPSLPEHTRATVLVALTDQEEARRACNNGVVWRAPLHDCEPYSAAVEPPSATNAGSGVIPSVIAESTRYAQGVARLHMATEAGLAKASVPLTQD